MDRTYTNGPDEFEPPKFDCIEGWLGLQAIISKTFCFSFKIHFILANSADPDEMGLHWLQKYPLGFPVLKRVLFLQAGTFFMICL